MFSAELEGVDELENDFRTAALVVTEGVSRGVMAAVKEGAYEARTRHTFKNRSGELEKSIEGKSFGWTNGGTLFEGEIRASSEHASLVENPTRPHVIIVRRAKWLHWEEPQGDHHFALKVNHPGTKGQPFMHLAYYKAERVLLREIEISLKRAEEILSA